jgi:hypothetical protein
MMPTNLTGSFQFFLVNKKKLYRYQPIIKTNYNIILELNLWFGNYVIKHGKELALYNAYGEGFGNKVAPRKAKVFSQNLERDIRTVNNFTSFSCKFLNHFSSYNICRDIFCIQIHLWHHHFLNHLIFKC